MLDATKSLTNYNLPSYYFLNIFLRLCTDSKDIATIIEHFVLSQMQKATFTKLKMAMINQINKKVLIEPSYNQQNSKNIRLERINRFGFIKNG